MKFYDKYPLLKRADFLNNILTETVFATMSLEDQIVPKIRVQQIVSDHLKEQQLKGDQFFTDKLH